MSQIYTAVRVKYRYYCQISATLEFSQYIFEKPSNARFHENQYSGSRVFLCRQTDRQTDMAKPIVTFRNFGNAPKMVYL
jgi:hypothetical protein